MTTTAVCRITGGSSCCSSAKVQTLTIGCYPDRRKLHNTTVEIYVVIGVQQIRRLLDNFLLSSEAFWTMRHMGWCKTVLVLFYNKSI